MKALTISHAHITKELLLEKAERTPGAWIGIRIAALLLVLSGWKSSQVADLFGLTRWAVVKWIQKANCEGIESIYDRPRSGRPSQFDAEIMRHLDEALSQSPQQYGIPSVRWDGVVVAEYLKKTYHIRIHVRHAQRLIRKLGYSLRRPIYRFVQATEEGVKEFREEVKKNRSRQDQWGKENRSFWGWNGFFPPSKAGQSVDQEGDAALCLHPQSTSATVESLRVGRSSEWMAWSDEMDQGKYGRVPQTAQEDCPPLPRQNHRHLGG
jgi:transposase